jgi:hypothetical protein
MEKQLFVSRTGRPESALFMEPSIQPAPVIHKPLGGLWTSTYDPHYGSAWVQWCLQEEFDGPVFDCYVLSPEAELPILVIDSYKDLVDALDTYGYIDDRFAEIGTPEMWRTFDWSVLQKKYAAVHLTAKGNSEVHFSFPVSLYGWDCESTCWLRWSFEQIEQLGKRKFERCTW